MTAWHLDYILSADKEWLAFRLTVNSFAFRNLLVVEKWSIEHYDKYITVLQNVADCLTADKT